MARVRVQPHLTAGSSAVRWAGWYLVTGSERHPLGPLLHGWDYDQAITIGTAPEIDLVELLDSTGLDDPTEIHLVITIDCPATSRRFVRHVPVTDFAGDSAAIIAVDIPQGSVALELKMACHLALFALRKTTGASASLKGSRLAESPTTRLILEGEASRFPTEAVSFTSLRWEAAAWSVRIDAEDMNEAFSGSVRLFLNTDHPTGAALASMEPRTYAALGSVLRIDIVRSTLLAAIEHVGNRGSAATGFDEDTFGAVAAQMANEYFNMELASVGELHGTDIARFERVLQSAVGMEVGLP